MHIAAVTLNCVNVHSDKDGDCQLLAMWITSLATVILLRTIIMVSSQTSQRCQQIMGHCPEGGADMLNVGKFGCLFEYHL